MFRASDKFTDPNIGKNWWAISFENPTNPSLYFVIENHSNSTTFHWTIIGTQKLQEGDEEIAKGATKTIPIENNFNQEKIRIEVTSENEKKAIYKNL